jgi:hypothetical protein
LNLEEIATCISSLQTEDDIHYIIGQIDIAEDYEPIYSYFTFRDQAYASDIVCPEKLEESLSSYLNTKKEFLLSVKSDFEGDKLLVNNKSFMFDCERLTSLLQNLHVSSDSLKDDNVLQEYSTSLNDVIKIMTYWIDQ